MKLTLGVAKGTTHQRIATKTTKPDLKGNRKERRTYAALQKKKEKAT
jgi:hypothetical protein